MSRKITVLNNAVKMVRLTTSIAYPGGTVRFTYNLLDQLAVMQDTIGTTGYAYDAAGRISSTTNPFGFTVGYAYDAAGNLTQLTYPGGRKVNYTYDALNRVKTVTIDWLADRPITTYSYDDAGRMTGLTTFNGITTSYGYDASNRITSLTSPMASYSFTLDGSGNRISETRTEPFSPAINTATTTYGYNTRGNRLLSAGTASFGYDNEGQLASGYGSSYSFDGHHRLTGAGGSSYFYDGGNNRLQATRSGTTTRYIYDAGGNLLAEADASNAITRYYVYGAGLLAMVTPANQVYCYHYNATGSTIAVTGQSQGMVNTYAYDPFGTIVGQQETIPQPFKFVGQFGVMAEPNGFYYMKARYYDPNAGRFISEDPLGFGGGDVNLMAYVGNNPVNAIDPSGLDWIYSQSTGNLFYQPPASLGGGPPQLIATGGYSGHGAGVNNSAMQDVPNIGPIPVGTWTIGPQQNNITSSGRTLPASMRLTPQDVDTERSGFLIHGDNGSGDQSASQGCIIYNRTIRNRIGDSGDNVLRVEQNYGCNR